jgi:hypothetical protein
MRGVNRSKPLDATIHGGGPGWSRTVRRGCGGARADRPMGVVPNKLPTPESLTEITPNPNLPDAPYEGTECLEDLMI